MATSATSSPYSVTAMPSSDLKNWRNRFTVDSPERIRTD
jgi:hypothetical protein